MIINLKSPVIQEIKKVADLRTVIKRREKLLNVCAVYSCIAFDLANQSRGITQKEIVSMLKINRTTVYRLVKLLVELGFLEEKKGKVVKVNGYFRRTKNIYKLTDKKDLEVFKKAKGFRGDFNSLSEFFLQFGSPKKKKQRNKLFYNCPQCGNTHCVDINFQNTKAFCVKCKQGYTIESVNWFDRWKEKLEKFKIRIESIYYRGISKNLLVIH